MWSSCNLWNNPRIREKNSKSVLKLVCILINFYLVSFHNKFDFNIKDLLGSLQEYSSRPLVLRQIPIKKDDQIIGSSDVIHERAYIYEKDKASQIVKIPEEISSTHSEIRKKVLEIFSNNYNK